MDGKRIQGDVLVLNHKMTHGCNRLWVSTGGRVELTRVEGDVLGADHREPQTFLVDFPLHEEQNESISILRPH